MKMKDMENHIKLDILRSIAKSERAISQLLEQVAAVDIRKHTDIHCLERELAALVRCQVGLIATMTGVRIRLINKSKQPGPVWINRKLPLSVHRIIP